MNASQSKGAANAMMIINIGLAVIITLAVSFLFSTNMQERLNANAKTTDLPSNTLITAKSSTQPGSENEIDLLKASLERETSRLEQLRHQKALVEKFRRQSQPTFANP